MAASGTGFSRRRFIRDGSLVVTGLAVGPAVLGPGGCTCGGPVEEGAGGEARSPETPEAWRDFDVRLALRDHLHLADLDHHGLFVDFGTASRFKYTLGNWRSGWGADLVEQGTTFTRVGAGAARAYFHLDEAAPLALIFRARPGQVDSFSVYVNDQAITRVRLPAGWSEQRVDVAPATTRAGENSLKLVHSAPSGADNAFALDYVRLVAGSAAVVEGQAFVRPDATSMRRNVRVGAEERPCLVLATPTRLSYFVEVPTEASLGFGAALVEGSRALVEVSATDAGTGRSERLLRAEVVSPEEAGRFEEQMVDLGAFAGKVTRLEIQVSSEAGSAEVALATPSLLSRRVTVRPGREEPARNVVVLLVDTLRADCLTCHNEQTRVRGPEVDRFARDAVVFERCQAPANWTKPSCASLLTGIHPPGHSAVTESAALSRSVRMVSETFQEAGFATGAFIANGYMAAEFGFNQGWSHYKNHIRERVPTEAEHVFGDAARWIEQNRTGRFFAYVQTIDPHVPYDPPEEDLRLYDAAAYSGPVSPRSTGNLLESFKRGRVTLGPRDRARLRALYDGEVTYHDRHFGVFVNRLRELGVLDDTIFVVTSDHGEEFFEHDSVGHGHSLHQELLHVPLIVRLPGLADPGSRLGAAVGLTDIVPTVLEATGLEVPQEVEGRSLVPDLRGAPPPLLSAAFASQWDTGNDHELAWTARMGDWKLRMHGPAISVLYDLARDPGETRDLDEAHPLALRALRIALGQFLGAPSRKAWTAANTERVSTRQQAEQAEMTPEMCEQLRALGYLNVESCQ